MKASASAVSGKKGWGVLATDPVRRVLRDKPFRGTFTTTVNLDMVINQLQKISAELIRDLKSRYVKLSDMLVPLSMALLSTYDDDYLGVGEEKPPEPLPSKKHLERFSE